MRTINLNASAEFESQAEQERNSADGTCIGVGHYYMRSAQELEKALDEYTSDVCKTPLSPEEIKRVTVQARRKILSLYENAYKHLLIAAGKSMVGNRHSVADSVYADCISIAIKVKKFGSELFDKRELIHLMHKRIDAIDGVVDIALSGREYSVASSYLATKASVKVQMATISYDIGNLPRDAANRDALKWALKAADEAHGDAKHKKEATQLERAVDLAVMLNKPIDYVDQLRGGAKEAFKKGARLAEARLEFGEAAYLWVKAAELASIIRDAKEEIDDLFELARLNGMHANIYAVKMREEHSALLRIRNR